MDEPPELADSHHWRIAVRALRAGYGCLGIALVGVVLLLVGATRWVLAAGVVGWLLCAGVTLTGFFRARQELPAPRPGLWPMRWMIISDSVHARSKGRS